MARRALPSVAPVDIEGTTITPGHNESVIREISFITSGRIVELGPGEDKRAVLTTTCSSPMAAFSVFNTYSGGSSGITRQFTVAAASWGSAFDACPPSSNVGAQVVRSIAFHLGYCAATWRIASSDPSPIFFRLSTAGPVSVF